MVMRLIFLLSLLVFPSLIVSAQSDGIAMEWARGSGGPNGTHTQGMDVLVDQQGNVYTYGRFMDSVDFDPGPSTYMLTSNGETDIFVQKLDQNGNLVWVISFGGSLYEYSFEFAFDLSNNLVLTGSFQGNVDLDPGSGVNMINADPNGDAFIMKLDPNGNLIWVKTIGASYIDGASGVAVDNNGDICIVGRYGQTVDFDPGPGVYYMTASNPVGEGFILKLTSNGNFIWARSAGWICGRVKINSVGDILIYGIYGGTYDFDPGPGVISLTSKGGTDAFVLKVTGNGTYSWVRSFGGILDDYSSELFVGNSQNIYISGSFQDSIDLDPGPLLDVHVSNGIDDLFVIKLNPNGNLIWANSFGGPSFDRITHTLDSSENIFSGGRFSGTVDFDPGPLVHNITGSGSYYLQKLNSNGGFEWVATQQGGNSQFYSVYEKNGSIYASGSCNSNTDIDPCVSVDILMNTHPSQVLTMKFNPCSNYASTDIITGCDSIIWIDGNTYTSSNNTATYVIPNNSGCCDSVITLDLTINTVDNGVIQVDDTTLQASSAGAQYQWLDCDNNFDPIPGQTSQIFIATSNGNYAVQVTENGCIDTSACIQITSVGIIESDIDGLMIFPNPANEIVHVRLGDTFRNVELRVYDPSGREVEILNFEECSQIELSMDQPPGLYLIKLRAEDRTAVVRILKQ